MCHTGTAAIVVVALPMTGRPEGYFPQDCGAATQNILFAAVDMGLGTYWCGVYPREERVAALRKVLGLPDSKIPFNIIAIGTPNEAPAPRGFFDEAKVSYVE